MPRNLAWESRVLVLNLFVLLLVVAPLMLLLLGKFAFKNSARRDAREQPIPPTTPIATEPPEDTVPGWVRAGPAPGKGYIWK